MASVFCSVIMVLLVGLMFNMSQAQDLGDLKYPNRSFLETLVSKPKVDTSGLENLRYPSDSLFSAILSKISGALSSVLWIFQGFDFGGLLQSFIGIKSFSTRDDDKVDFNVGSNGDFDSGSEDENNASALAENILPADSPVEVEAVNVFDNDSETVEEITTLSSASFDLGETSSTKTATDSEPMTDVPITTNIPDQEATKKIDDEFSNEVN